MVRGATMLAVLVLLAAPARADEHPRPWVDGVPDDTQRHANELFAEANEFLDQGLFKPALPLYREAIATWDHPLIHYNLAVALINLAQPLEAYDHLEAALRWDGAALGDDLLAQALIYRRLLDTQIARVEVTCDEPDARISLDDRELLRCPGTAAQRVLAGAHRLTGEKPGFLTRTIELALSGDDDREVRIEMMSLDDTTVRHRRWAVWKPWAVIGSGAVVGLIGLVVELDARAILQSYDDAIDVLCADQPCAELPEVVTDAYARGRRESQVAAGLFVAGGAAVITGIALLVINRTVSQRVGYEDAPIVPILGPDRAGLAARVRF